MRCDDGHAIHLHRADIAVRAALADYSRELERNAGGPRLASGARIQAMIRTDPLLRAAIGVPADDDTMED